MSKKKHKTKNQKKVHSKEKNRKKTKTNKKKDKFLQKSEITQIVFISYSHDSDSHKEWVKKLASNLKDNGIIVHFDQEGLRPGMDVNLYSEESIRNADKVLLILTPEYARKADNREGGVGYEYSIINSEIQRKLNIGIPKYIPILRDGEREESHPIFLKALIDIDMRNDKSFDSDLDYLLREITYQPEITRLPIKDLTHYN